MNTKDYLLRIGVEAEDLEPTEEVLRLLQRKHLQHVPFENLDIHWKRPIVLDTGKFYEKIVKKKRGGFCYELNGLFNDLLRDIGFSTRIVSARVADDKGDFGPEFDHMAIIVAIDDDEFLADVGFGAFTAESLRFVLDEQQQDDTGSYIIKQLGDGYFQVARKDGDEWKSEYIFRDIPHELSEFAEMCDFQQYSPESHFTKGKVCSLLTGNGRKTLTDKKFIVTAHGEKTETAVESEKEFERILEREFVIRPLSPH